MDLRFFRGTFRAWASQRGVIGTGQGWACGVDLSGVAPTELLTADSSMSFIEMTIDSHVKPS